MAALHLTSVVPSEGTDADRSNGRKAQLEKTTNVPTTISARVKSCLRLLDRWKSNQDSGTRADDALSLLRLWATKNFVFTNDRMSLDWRLRHVEVLSSVIVDLLDELQSSVQMIIDLKRAEQAEARTESETSADLETIGNIQAQLFDICRGIHHSGILSRFSKLAHYQHILRIKDKEINMTETFRKEIGDYVDARYRKASETVRQRLADSISLRRQNFLYLRDREVKAGREPAWEKDTETGQRPANEHAEDQGPTAPAIQDSLDSRSSHVDQGHVSKPQPPSSIFSTSATYPHKTMRPASVQSSSTFAASSHPGISKMIPPPPPKTDSGYIKCPYCFLICREEEMRNESWKQHFLQDLMPYVCLLEDCSTPDVLFDSFKCWSDHMISQHPITTWICNNRTHRQPYRFVTSAACGDHMMAQHANEFDKADLSEIVEASELSQPRIDPLTWCPICGDDFDADLKPPNDILGHVAEHLVYLAFCSLPLSDNEEAGKLEKSCFYLTSQHSPGMPFILLQAPDQPQSPISFCESPAAMSSPTSEPLKPVASQISPQQPSRKRKFETVEPQPPTSVFKRRATFTRGSYDTASELPKTTRFKELAEKAGKIYNYDSCPLEKGHLRLLFLKPSEDKNDSIIVELQAFSIDELVENPHTFQFTALSYDWGTGEEDKEILVDMTPDNQPPAKMEGVADVAIAWKRRMKPIWVKPNLHAFLKEFRHPTREVALWVDRVCINQANNEEKADQVSKMGIIYSTAANVAIWLGTADDKGKSDRAMDFIGSMLKQDVEQKLNDEHIQDEYAKQWSDLLSLMQRRWFSRRWVIQELALAKNAEVRCGSKRVHWHDFSDAVSILELHFDIILKIIKRRRDLEETLGGIKDMKPLGARILVEVLSNTFQRHANGTIYSPRQGLESLISSLSTFETSDPRDTIYTLLNLAKETFNLPSEDKVRKEKRLKRNEANPPPFPDYDKNLLDVYTNFMKWCIKESGSLDILCRPWALPEVKEKPDKFYPDLVELPSWITTVRDSAFGSQQESFGGWKTGDSFVGSPDNRCYNASLNQPPDIQWGRDQGVAPTKSPISRLSSGKQVPKIPQPQQGLSRVLTVKGFYLGQVKERHQVPQGIITKEVLEALGHDPSQSQLVGVPDSVWRTLVADRGPDGKAPPAWYHRACITCLAADTSSGNIDINQILQKKDTTKMQAGYLKRVQAVCWNRTFIECGNDDDGNKLFGIAPVTVKTGDLVCILYGCSVPCILRQTLYGSGSDSKEGGSEERGSKDPSYFYQLIGEAFILGQMDGEAIMDLSEEDLRSASDDFHLV